MIEKTTLLLIFNFSDNNFTIFCFSRYVKDLDTPTPKGAMSALFYTIYIVSITVVMIMDLNHLVRLKRFMSSSICKELPLFCPL